MKNDPLEEAGPLQPGEIQQVVFDFAENRLEPSESIAEIITVAVSAYFGEDAAASSLLSGDASIVGGTVVQRVAMRRPGVTYLIRCTVRGSSGLRHTLSALLPCVTAA